MATSQNKLPKQTRRSRSEYRKEKTVSRIRSLGDSKGIILNSKLIKAAGLQVDEDITIEAGKGVIIIAQAATGVNTNLKTWDAQFKKAIKAGEVPEVDLFEALENEFDKTEW